MTTHSATYGGWANGNPKNQLMLPSVTPTTSALSSLTVTVAVGRDDVLVGEGSAPEGCAVGVSVRETEEVERVLDPEVAERVLDTEVAEMVIVE